MRYSLRLGVVLRRGYATRRRPDPIAMRCRQPRPACARSCQMRGSDVARDRTGLLWCAWRARVACSGGAARRSPGWDLLRPRLRAGRAAAARRRILFGPHRLHAFSSLCWDRATQRARTRAPSTEIGTRPPWPRWDDPRKAGRAALQSEPITRASAPRGAEHALGGAQARDVGACVVCALRDPDAGRMLCAAADRTFPSGWGSVSVV